MRRPRRAPSSRTGPGSSLGALVVNSVSWRRRQCILNNNTFLQLQITRFRPTTSRDLCNASQKFAILAIASIGSPSGQSANLLYGTANGVQSEVILEKRRRRSAQQENSCYATKRSVEGKRKKEKKMLAYLDDYFRWFLHNFIFDLCRIKS